MIGRPHFAAPRQPDFDAPKSMAIPADRLGQDLKIMFDRLTEGPMPERLVQLADALEAAFQRGELFETLPRHHA